MCPIMRKPIQHVLLIALVTYRKVIYGYQYIKVMIQTYHMIRSVGK